LFADLLTRVCEKDANSIGFMYGPCSVFTVCIHMALSKVSVYGYVHGCVHGSCPWPCTGREHMYTTMCTAVYTAVYGSCTRPFTGRLHGCYKAVYRCTRPCTHLSDRVRTCVRTRIVYTAVYVHNPCTGLVHGRVTRTRSAHGRVNGP